MLLSITCSMFATTTKRKYKNRKITDKYFGVLRWSLCSLYSLPTIIEICRFFFVHTKKVKNMNEWRQNHLIEILTSEKKQERFCTHIYIFNNFQEKKRGLLTKVVTAEAFASFFCIINRDKLMSMFRKYFYSSFFFVEKKNT